MSALFCLWCSGCCSFPSSSISKHLSPGSWHFRTRKNNHSANKKRRGSVLSSTEDTSFPQQQLPVQVQGILMKYTHHWLSGVTHCSKSHCWASARDKLHLSNSAALNCLSSPTWSLSAYGPAQHRNALHWEGTSKELTNTSGRNERIDVVRTWMTPGPDCRRKIIHLKSYKQPLGFCRNKLTHR